jgi:hypothetical protein
MNSQHIDQGEVVRTGAGVGAQAGCGGAVLFALLLLGHVLVRQLIGGEFTTMGTIFELIPIFTHLFFLAALVGIIPATIIGAVSGALIGCSFYLVRPWLTATRVAVVCGGGMGLALTFPALIGWIQWLTPAARLTELDWRVIVLVIALCTGAGSYGGLKLSRVLQAVSLVDRRSEG